MHDRLRIQYVEKKGGKQKQKKGEIHRFVRFTSIKSNHNLSQQSERDLQNKQHSLGEKLTFWKKSARKGADAPKGGG